MESRKIIVTQQSSFIQIVQAVYHRFLSEIAASHRMGILSRSGPYACNRYPEFLANSLFHNFPFLSRRFHNLP
jgi:hypothetical protein